MGGCGFGKWVLLLVVVAVGRFVVGCRRCSAMSGLCLVFQEAGRFGCRLYRSFERWVDQEEFLGFRSSEAIGECGHRRCCRR